MSRSPARLQSPLAYAAVGASILAVPASAAAAVAASAHQPAPGSPIKAKIKRRRIEYGGEVVVVGDAPASDRGQTIVLEYSSATTGSWTPIASAPIRAGGRFRLVSWLRKSGWVQATIASGASAARMTAPAGSSSSTSGPIERIAVSAGVRVRARAVNQLSPRAIELRGVLLPAAPRRTVLLQGESGGRWVTVARARTGAGGWFILRYRPRGLGHTRLRVRFAGDSINAAASARAGSVTVYHQSVASWYYDGGTTACGFHAYYGVANLSLPCGTTVSFMSGGRVVQAVVDDRGPYVGGRTWDLNQNTAAALGVAGVVTVWSSR